VSGAGLSWSGVGPGDTRPRWSIALVVVLALHAGAVAALLVRHEPAERMAATEAILIDMTPAPPAKEPIPEPEEAHAAPPPPQAEEPPPPPEPPPPEVTPEVVLPSPPPPPTPPPPQRRPLTPRHPRPQAVTSHAAPAETPAEPAPVAAPAAPGTATAPRAGGGGISSWQGQLMGRLQAVRRYPESSRARREEGVVQLNFTMDRAGNVLSARIARSSGYPALDQETLELARRASPLPSPPDEVAGNPLTLTVPVRFSLR
jgi:protein TonB